mmetsp:Transcript_25430/g.41005  ORF Transcript_25430/g.41005 Transcript_25430/m.41005 type:complete len:104 (-) Transcript_25430:2337-2648(-)|eukprot:CAMPEP_0203754200 /NCGR_PEP_ID=MMETSP0098-20131031/7838_1 /ASSEMBLY_ACC=CAM_ASM_000208 /TAXON_ID=96639 /ORGANISM=" , Strain NY0313808BC1" /LENGTH=103 /DNA_ID=CAMNT_0050645103 /DNA_START=25 /DNA_END=336 /DNA_ORIENTATION=+
MDVFLLLVVAWVCFFVHAENAQPEEDVPLLAPVEEEAGLPQVPLGGSIKFEELGPIILNSDGTTRRIENWQQLSQREREWTLKKIAQRNKERADALAQEKQEL